MTFQYRGSSDQSFALEKLQCGLKKCILMRKMKRKQDNQPSVDRERIINVGNALFCVRLVSKVLNFE